MSIAESSIPIAVPVPTGGDDPTKIAMLGLTSHRETHAPTPREHGHVPA